MRGFLACWSKRGITRAGRGIGAGCGTRSKREGSGGRGTGESFLFFPHLSWDGWEGEAETENWTQACGQGGPCEGEVDGYGRYLFFFPPLGPSWLRYDGWNEGERAGKGKERGYGENKELEAWMFCHMIRKV